MRDTIDLSKIKENDEDFYQTDFATLFIVKDEEQLVIPVPESMQERLGVASVPVTNAGGSGLKEFILYYTDFDHDGSELHEMHHILRSESGEDDNLTVRISSPGGSVFEGFELVHIIKERFNNRTTTVLESMAASMGAVTFCAGDKRVVYEDSVFMLHDWAGASFGTGTNQLIQATFFNKVIDKQARKLIVDSGFLTEEEYASTVKAGTEFWVDTEEMVYRGIATHVMVEDTLLTGEEFLDYFNSGLSFYEYNAYMTELYEEEHPDVYTKEKIAQMVLDGEIEIKVGE